MRTLRYYLISLAVHGLGLGAAFLAFYLAGFTAPRFSVGGGGGGAAGGGGIDVPTFEGEFLTANRVAVVRVTAFSRPMKSEPAENKPLETGRLFTGTVDKNIVARHVEAVEAAPSNVPPAPLPRRDRMAMSPDAVSPTLSRQRPGAGVDVGELAKISVEHGTAVLSAAATSLPDSLPGSAGSAGGGGDGGMPSPLASNVRPPYPPEALLRGVEGRVVLRVVVGEDGGVQSAAVETSSGDTSLDQSALTTIRYRWHFEPARRAGMPVAMEVRVPIRFRLRPL